MTTCCQVNDLQSPADWLPVTSRSAPGPTLGNEYKKPLPIRLDITYVKLLNLNLFRIIPQSVHTSLPQPAFLCNLYVFFCCAHCYQSAADSNAGVLRVTWITASDQKKRSCITYLQQLLHFWLTTTTYRTK